VIFPPPRQPLLPDRGKKASEKALAGKENPFIQTDRAKKKTRLSLVNFFYPKSIQANGLLALRKGSGDLTFIGDVPTGGRTLSTDRVRFYIIDKTLLLKGWSIGSQFSQVTMIFSLKLRGSDNLCGWRRSFCKHRLVILPHGSS